MGVDEALRCQLKTQQTTIPRNKHKSRNAGESIGLRVYSDLVACYGTYPVLYARPTLPCSIFLGHTRMRAFVTVGSTRFDALVQRALSDAVLDVLRRRGYSTIVVQCGDSDFDSDQFTQDGESWTRALEGGGAVEVWRFKASLDEEYRQADLVISHAGTSRCIAPTCFSRSFSGLIGSGTILDVLRLQKPLIVVPNSTLLDDHQQELASALAGLGHVRAATVPWVFLVLPPCACSESMLCRDLPQIIAALDPSTLIPFPKFDGSRFREILDEEMGFALGV